VSETFSFPACKDLGPAVLQILKNVPCLHIHRLLTNQTDVTSTRPLGISVPWFASLLCLLDPTICRGAGQLSEISLLTTAMTKRAVWRRNLVVRELVIPISVGVAIAFAWNSGVGNRLACLGRSGEQRRLIFNSPAGSIDVKTERRKAADWRRVLTGVGEPYSSSSSS
jgi:hypothetical protein